MTTNNQPDELNELFDLAVEAKDNLRGAESASEVRYGDEQLAEAKQRLNALIDKKWKAGYDSGVEDTHELHATPRLQPINYSQEQLDKAVREARIDELKAYDEQPTYESGDDYVTKRLTELQNNQPKKGEDNE